MALIWYEGWDCFQPGNMAASPLAGPLSSLGYVASLSPYGTCNIAASAARFGGEGISLTNGSGPGEGIVSVSILFGPNVATGFFGTAMNMGNWVAAGAIITLVDAATATTQCSVQFGANGIISAYTGAGVLLGASSPIAYAASTWNYVEIGATIAAAASGGALSVRVNTVPVLTLTNVDTQASANAWFSQVVCGLGPGGPSLLLDDMYLCDATGAAPFNTYLGNARAQFLKPGAPGASTQFTPSNTAEANWQNAGNTNVDDTLYVYSGTTGAEDDYTVAPMASQPTIWAARVKIAARQDDATQRFIEPCLISAGTEVRDAAVALTQTYTWVAGAIHTVDPHTGAAWTYQAINAAQVGVNLST